MKTKDWAVEIIRVMSPPGYRLRYPNEMVDGWAEGVISDGDSDLSGEIVGMESLLWFIIDHFGCGGSKHDPERIRVVRERQDGVLLFQGDEFHHFPDEYTEGKGDVNETG